MYGLEVKSVALDKGTLLKLRLLMSLEPLKDFGSSLHKG